MKSQKVNKNSIHERPERQVFKKDQTKQARIHNGQTRENTRTLLYFIHDRPECKQERYSWEARELIKDRIHDRPDSWTRTVFMTGQRVDQGQYAWQAREWTGQHSWQASKLIKDCIHERPESWSRAVFMSGQRVDQGQYSWKDRELIKDSIHVRPESWSRTVFMKGQRVDQGQYSWKARESIKDSIHKRPESKHEQY